MEAGKKGESAAAWRSCLPEATVKLTWDQPGPLIVLKTDDQAQAAGIVMVPKLVPTKDLS